MRKGVKKHIGVVTGPTGGHFFPGLAAAEDMRSNEDVEICFFVPEREYISQWLRKKGFRYFFIPSGRLSSKDIFSPFKFFFAVIRAVIFLSSEKIDIVFITGSYITVPFLIAAFFCRRKIVVHEQNFVPGRVTSLSVFLSCFIALTFPGGKISLSRKVFLTGFPLLTDFRKKHQRTVLFDQFGFSPDNLTVLVLGGSQGSDFLNRLVCGNLNYFHDKKFQFIHLTGANVSNIREFYERNCVRAQVFNFFYDMSKLYNIADLVICRAGAGTIAEITYWNIPPAIVPYPYAGAHQEKNANFLRDREACIVIPQKESSIEAFPDIFAEFLSRRETIKKALEKIDIADVKSNTANLLCELAGIRNDCRGKNEKYQGKRKGF